MNEREVKDMINSLFDRLDLTQYEARLHGSITEITLTFTERGNTASILDDRGSHLHND